MKYSEIQLPEEALAAIRTLEQCGHEAWAVGGCVRDLLLGRTPGDADVATSATPAQMLDAFQSIRLIPTGIRHGTMTAILAGRPVEITTYRQDGDYRDFRRPEQVTFARTLEEDLSRRDFTVNGMAYHPRRGLMDRFGGMDDLKGKIIRTIGPAAERFGEDALRILRAFRFMAQLDFSLDEDTFFAAGKCREGLRRISPERITSELGKLLSCPGPGSAVQALLRSQALDWILPRTSENVPDGMNRQPPEEILRLALLMSGLPHEEAERRLCFLRLPAKKEKAVRFLLRQGGEEITPEKAADRNWVRLGMMQMGFENFRMYCRYRSFRDDSWKAADAAAEEISRSGECYRMADLAVNGNDLLAAGIPPVQIGGILNMLLAGAAGGKIKNERAALLERAGKLLKAFSEPERETPFSGAERYRPAVRSDESKKKEEKNGI